MKSKVATVRNFWLSTLKAALTTICFLMQRQIQLGNYIHACTPEIYSLANLQDLIPALASLCCLYYGCQSGD